MIILPHHVSDLLNRLSKTLERAMDTPNPYMRFIEIRKQRIKILKRRLDYPGGRKYRSAARRLKLWKAK